MKNSEDAIGKVLGGLRDAEAPVGLERRILHGLEERVAGRAGHRTGAGWRGWLPVWLVEQRRPVAVGSLVCGVALAGMVAVGLGIPAVRRLGRAPASTRTGIASAGPVALGASEVAGKSAQPVSASSRVALRALTGTKTERQTNAEGGIDRDAVAVEATHATSYPAPPMPLTEQERLLLRLVHKDDPVELAMLDPKVRALQELEDKAEFQRFFGQSAKPVATEQLGMKEGVPQQSTTEQELPEQTAPEQSVPEPPAQPPSVPEYVGSDQSTTQHAGPRPTRTTGENE